jgi:hypothetical protein
VLEVLANDSKALEAWELLFEEARERKKSANTVAEACRNDSAEVKSVTEILHTGMAEIGRMFAQGFEDLNKKHQEEKRERANLAMSMLTLAAQHLDDSTRDKVTEALDSNKNKRESAWTNLAPKKPKNSTLVEENRVTLLSFERLRAHQSTSIEDFRANYESDFTCAWEQARKEELKKNGNGTKLRKHFALMRQYKQLATQKFANLNLALDGVDATKFNKRLLQKVAPGKSFDRIEDVEVKKLIAKEFERVARKLNEKRTEVREVQVDEAKSILRQTLEEEWPELSTTPASGDDQMEMED